MVGGVRGARDAVVQASDQGFAFADQLVSKLEVEELAVARLLLEGLEVAGQLGSQPLGAGWGCGEVPAELLAGVER